MRLLHITTYYPSHLGQFYANHPDLATQSYETQHAALMAECYRWANFFSSELGKLGYEASDIVSNAEPLQKAWANEHGIHCSSNDWMHDVVFAQIAQIRPEILLLGEWPDEFGPQFVTRCRTICPSIKLVVGWCGEAHPPAPYFRNHDLALSCAPDTVADLNRQGIKSAHLNHAFAPAIVPRLQSLSARDITTIPVGFVGQVLYGNNYHSNRARLFAAVAQATGLRIFGSVEDLGTDKPARGSRRRLRLAYYGGLRLLDGLGLSRFAERFPRYGWYREAENRPIFTRLRQVASKPLFGLQMYERIKHFHICLNAHGSSPFASNMRLFETTGVGTCLLTDWKRNLPDLFEPDREVVTYRTAEECIEKVRYLLNHEDARQAIAAAGQKRTLRDHTFTQRAEQLDGIIRAALKLKS